MARSPEWKVYRNGEYVAACKYAEDAAAVVSLTSSGTVKHGHSLVVWSEGHEEFSAGESYDSAARIMMQRRHDHYRACFIKTHGYDPDAAA